MKERRRLRVILRWLRWRLPNVGAWATVVLGVSGLLSEVLQLRPGEGVSFLTAASLLALGGALLARLREHRSWSQALAVLVTLLQLLLLAHLASGLSVADGWKASLNGTVVMALAGLSVLALEGLRMAALLLGATVFTSGTVAVVGIVAHAPAPFSWGALPAQAITTSLALMTLGTAIVACAYREERPRVDRALRWAEAVVATTVAVAGVLFWLGLRSEAAKQRQRTIQATARGMAGEVAARVDFMIEALERLAEHGASLPGGWTSTSDWASDARISLGSFSGFETAEWIDSSFRTRAAAPARKELRELVNEEPDRDRLQRALERARRAGQPAIAAPFQFVDGGVAFRIILPLAAVGHPEAFLSGVFSFDESFAALFGNFAPEYDAVLYSGTEEVLKRGEARFDHPIGTSEVDLADPATAWVLVASPRPDMLVRMTSRLPEVALGASLLVAALLALVIRLAGDAYRRAEHFEHAVRQRTRELEGTLAAFEEENIARRRSEAVLRLTRRVERAVAAELDPRRAMQAVVDATQELTRAELVALFLAANGHSAKHAEPDVIASSVSDPLLSWVTRHRQRIVASVIAARRPLRLADLGLPRKNAEPAAGVFLGIPVRSRLGAPRGALVLVDSRTDQLRTSEEEIGVSLAAQAAIALDNAHLYDEERKARSAAQSASAAKDRFMTMLSHELRNPLGSIRSAIEALSLKSGGGTDERRMRSIIARQAGHLSRMADELLDASRIERGKVSLERRPLDLAAEVGQVLEAFAPRIEQAELELSTELPVERLWVDSDPTRLAQIIGNLLSNAIKFTPAGGLIQVTVRREGGDGLISIRDNGPGIRAEELSLLFEPFVQSEASAQLGTGGLGLGLAIVKGLVESHGGEVTAHSDGKGKGAEFVVRLPLRTVPQMGEEPAPLEARGAKRRILVIDDHLDSSEGLAELLRMAGHSVELAVDGRTGLEMARRQHPQLVICDLGLPGLDGYAIARELRSDPELQNTEIVALSGFGDDSAVERAREAGFDDHLIKPINPQVLRQLAAGLRRLRFRSAAGIA